MKFQLFVILSLAYVSAAYQYNYYASPLSYTAETTPEVSEYGNTLPKATPVTPVISMTPVTPVVTIPEVRELNPCTEEVLRSAEIQAFRDPSSEFSMTSVTPVVTIPEVRELNP